MIKYDINHKDNTVTATKEGTTHHGKIIREDGNIRRVEKTTGDTFSLGHNNSEWEEAFSNVCHQNQNDDFKGTDKNKNGTVTCKRGTSIRTNGGKRSRKSRRTRKSKKTRKSRKNRRKSNRRKSRR